MAGKRISVLLLAAAVLAGCGGDGGGGDEEAAPPPAKKLKVGLVTDLGQLSDRGFNQLAYEGLKRAESRLGVEGRVFQSATPADYIPNMTTMAKQKFDLIIGVGFAQGDAVAKTAARFPDRRFAIIDVDQATLAGKPDNVVGLLFREEEVGYLAGYLAALTEKRRPGRDVISSVGGVKEPPVDRFIAGYQAGARKAVPGIEVLNGYSQDWDDQAKCKELALNQIARGAGVVFQVAGGCGLGALDAAGDRDVWGVGVDADQSFLGPHILTSAQKKVDRAVFLTIQNILDGRWRAGRNLTFGLGEGGVGLGKVSPQASRSDLAAVEKIEQQIVAGTITGLPRTVG